MNPPFGERLRQAVQARGQLCVGIDPHESLLEEWDLPRSAVGVREFGLRVIEVAAQLVGVIKPQVAFYEQYGAAGFAALEEVFSAARAAGLIVIADAKRGDIGSTMRAYTKAWLAPGAPLEVDALTVSPYLGIAALDGAVSFAKEHGKGLFVLAATSNPEAAAHQASTDSGGRSVAAQVISQACEYNEAEVAAEQWASVGVVIGATVELHALGIPQAFRSAAPILAPGFGYQGARVEEIRDLFGTLTPYVLANESRSILKGNPADLASRMQRRVDILEGSVR